MLLCRRGDGPSLEIGGLVGHRRAGKNSNSAKMNGRQSGTDRSDENTIEQGNDSTPRERERVSREQYLVPSVIRIVYSRF